jgi:hypothetical protein
MGGGGGSHRRIDHFLRRLLADGGGTRPVIARRSSTMMQWEKSGRPSIDQYECPSSRRPFPNDSWLCTTLTAAGRNTNLIYLQSRSLLLIGYRQQQSGWKYMLMTNITLDNNRDKYSRPIINMSRIMLCEKRTITSFWLPSFRATLLIRPAL